MDTETTDSSQKSETSLLEIHSKINTTGEKLYNTIEELFKKYSFNNNDTWKSEVAEKFCIPSVYLQPSEYLPCHLYREIWSRKKYFKLYFRYPKAIEEDDYAYPSDKNSNIDAEAIGPNEDESNNIACGRFKNNARKNKVIKKASNKNTGWML